MPNSMLTPCMAPLITATHVSAQISENACPRATPITAATRCLSVAHRLRTSRSGVRVSPGAPETSSASSGCDPEAVFAGFKSCEASQSGLVVCRRMKRGPTSLLPGGARKGLSRVQQLNQIGAVLLAGRCKRAEPTKSIIVKFANGPCASKVVG